MSEKFAMTLDAQQIEKMFSDLTSKGRKQAINGALRSSAGILKKETDRQFKSRLHIPSGRVYKPNALGYTKKNWKPTQTATVKLESKNQLAKVHIMKEYRAKFFELGTKARWTKEHRYTHYYTRRLGGGARKYRAGKGKGGYRGAVGEGRMFRWAQEATEQLIFSEIDKQMSKLVMKIAKKYGA